MKNQRSFLQLSNPTFAVFSILVLLGLGACASNPNKAKDLDTKIDAKGGYAGETIGLNDNKS